jgi:glycosyl hydrolase family 59 (putative galactocerebrosidase)
MKRPSIQYRPPCVLGLMLALCASVTSSFAESKIWNFDKDKPQGLPPGWLSEHTGRGAKGNWLVLADPSAPSQPNVLAQTSADNTSYRFPLAIVDNTNCKDLDMSVRFKTISGKEDQGAGLVWRYRDANNYYIVRGNALEDNVVLYKVANGKRIPLAPKGTAPGTYGVKHKVPGNTWNKLSLKVKGNLFEVSFNGEKLFEVEDKTFPDAGKVGLWTKADSVIHFDDFTVDSQ